MMRFVAPLILAAAAGFVAYSNHDGDNEFFLLPFVEVLPWVGDSLQARGDATWQILAGMAVVSVGISAWSTLRRRARIKQDDSEMQDADKLREWKEATPWKDVHDDDAT